VGEEKDSWWPAANWEIFGAGVGWVHCKGARSRIPRLGMSALGFNPDFEFSMSQRVT